MQKMTSTNIKLSNREASISPSETSYNQEFIRKQGGTGAKRIGAQPKSSLTFQHFDTTKNQHVEQYKTEMSERFDKNMIKKAVKRFNTSTTRNMYKPKEHMVMTDKFKTSKRLRSFDWVGIGETTNQAIYTKKSKQIWKLILFA
jgi:hypothetical protein